MAHRHMKRHWTLLVIREMQIKVTMSYHLTLVRMTIIKKSTNKQCCRRCGEKGSLVYCWWECKLVQSLWKTLWSFLRKLKIELPYDVAIPLLGIYLEKNENTNLKRCMHPNVHPALFIIAKIWKQPKCPSTEKWIKKIWIYMDTHTHTHTKWNITQP